MKRALAIAEKALGPSIPRLARGLKSRRAVRGAGPIYRGRASFKAGAGHCEKALGPEHPDIGPARQPGTCNRAGPLCRGRAAL